MSGFIVKRTHARVQVEKLIHTASNNYQCNDPDCICHDAEESDAPMLWGLRSTAEAMQRLRESEVLA